MHQQWICKSHFLTKNIACHGLPFNNRTNLGATSQLIWICMWLMHELRRCLYPCFIGGHYMILHAEWNIYILTTKCWYWSVFTPTNKFQLDFLRLQYLKIISIYQLPRSFIWKHVLRWNLKLLMIAEGLLQAIIESSFINIYKNHKLVVFLV